MHDTLRATVAASLLRLPPVASLPPALHEMAGSTGGSPFGAFNASLAFGRLQQIAGRAAGVPDVWDMGHPIWVSPGGAGAPAAMARLARAGAVAGQRWRVA